MGTISIEHSDRLYWLGRYTERVFTTLKTLHELIDRMLESRNCYTEYLSCLGISDTYEDNKAFIHSFLYDSSNPNSIAYSLERAYDNGIVLREEISTDALSFLQLAKDTLKKSEKSVNTRFSLLPLEDLLFGFWGCIEDHVYDEEIKNIIFIGKSVERLDLYIRMKYSYGEVYKEFQRLCKWLRNVPGNTPFRYNTQYLGSLVEIIGEEQEYRHSPDIAVTSLERLFEKAEVRI
ncbi:MAG: alpha-E domain-containing protein [Ruminococcus sp.]